MGATLPSYNPVLVSLANINATIVANTLAYTNTTSKKIIVTGSYVRCSAASAITIGPTVGIGKTAGTNDLFASTPLTALVNITKVFGFSLVGMAVVVMPNETIYINLSLASTGVSQTIVVDVLGYLI